MRISRDRSMLRVSEDQFARVAWYCQSQADILALYLYGSYGTPEQTPLSDLDLAVLPELARDRRRLLEVHADLAGILGDDVNLVDLGTVPVNLQFRIVATGRPLYVRDPGRVADFVAGVILRHADFAPDLASIYRDWDEAVREEYEWP